MSSLDRLIPRPRRAEIDSVDVAAPPDRVWQAVRHGELGKSPLIRALFRLRTREAVPALRLDHLRSTPNEPGFQILFEEPPSSVVVGAIGQVWKLDIPFVHVETADAYRAFDAPGEVKVAWAIELDALPRGGTHVALELRVDATDDPSWTKFRHYFRVIGPPSRFIRRSLLASLRRELGPADDATVQRRFRDVASGIGGAAIMAADFFTPFLRSARSHWGLDEQAARRTYAGDDLVAVPRWQWTHAIAIERACKDVWPWVAQFGADRAGFYSYEWLENLAGCELHNANAIHPEWEVREGDALRLHPKMPALRVISVEPERGFVAYGAPDERARDEGRPWAAVTWAFLLEPLGPSRCRFVSRYRCATSDDLATRASFGPTLVEPIGFAMDRRMLLGVKQRAERQPSL